jgi:hypothetical protein
LLNGHANRGFTCATQTSEPDGYATLVFSHADTAPMGAKLMNNERVLENRCDGGTIPQNDFQASTPSFRINFLQAKRTFQVKRTEVWTEVCLFLFILRVFVPNPTDHLRHLRNLGVDKARIKGRGVRQGNSQPYNLCAIAPLSPNFCNRFIVDW